MKHRLHTHIFFPALLVIVLFSVAVCLGFTFTSGRYTRYTAEKRLNVLMQSIDREYSRIYGALPPVESLDHSSQREYAKQLLNQVKERLKHGERDADLLVLNSKKKVVYPSDVSVVSPALQLYEECLHQMEDGSLMPGSPVLLKLSGNPFLVQLYEVKSTGNIRAQYYIGYTRIPDLSLLLSYTWQLLAAIVVICLLLAALAVWLLARIISRPIESLCQQADQIGAGSYIPLEEQYAITELDKLKNSFNDMTRRLKEAEEQNTRFFQNVSHDLRTPLVAISGYAQGIQCGILPDDKKAAEIILTESLRMKQLVESILAISKMDNHAFQLHMTDIQLDEFLEEQVDLLQGARNGKELVIHQAVPTTIKADPDLLSRIFQNVISNCIRYAATKVSVDLSIQDSRALITVSDDGPGISPEDLPYIFDRFYKGEHGNFGIGLSVVKSGIEYMDGTITIENKAAPHHGAVYSLTLPVVTPADYKPC
ncbi:ATP-binding protein [Ventrimonas sp. CLA-AP-H27]|uniref:histidine kinase n=1 Tax=Ventrimonas faecis TaxID=3133170 RepID=A0ABV1HQJ0_9FIRM